MVICGSYMFESCVSKDMRKRITMINGSRIPTHLLAYLLTLIVKKIEN